MIESFHDIFTDGNVSVSIGLIAKNNNGGVSLAREAVYMSSPFSEYYNSAHLSFCMLLIYAKCFLRNASCYDEQHCICFLLAY